ncbi:MAG: ACT domain-containing protein [Desulfofustis sp.]|nr:ACT domain-containing protein [Desulfofustis sp.]
MTATSRGETELHRLLAGLAPRLLPEAYIFYCLPCGVYGDGADLAPLAAFREEEGLTLVIPEEHAKRARIAYESVFRCITLTIHSSLDGIGLTAAVSTKLAEYGISVNVIAAVYHDHLLVPADQAERALTALAELSES